MKKATKIADELFTREDMTAQFWKSYYQACQNGTNTRVMNARAEQLLKRQNLVVKRFLKSIT